MIRLGFDHSRLPKVGAEVSKLGSRLPLGRLPGDFHIQRDGVDFYFPLTTGLLVSLAITLLLWWLRR